MASDPGLARTALVRADFDGCGQDVGAIDVEIQVVEAWFEAGRALKVDASEGADGGVEGTGVSDLRGGVECGLTRWGA